MYYVVTVLYIVYMYMHAHNYRYTVVPPLLDSNSTVLEQTHLFLPHPNT